MIVEQILRQKGRDVHTIAPLASIIDAVAAMEEHGIGALVVCEGREVKGIISERDIIHAIARSGTDSLRGPVTSLMTRDVVTCKPGDAVNDIMSIMTEMRIRHLPVVSGRRLLGLISIGDVVKQRIGEVEQEADAMRAYIVSA